MPRYDVHIINTVGTSIPVEADTPEQAAEQVWDADGFQNLAGLCHHCERAVGSLGDWDIATNRDADGVEQFLVTLAEDT